MTMPTTVLFTDQHTGWINVVPAYAETTALPLPMNGVAGLVLALPRIESW
jgi:hypothetical protein